MRIVHSKKFHGDKQNSKIAKIIAEVSESLLHEFVCALSIPRHYDAERENNQKIKKWIFDQFQSYGLSTFYQGPMENVVALQDSNRNSPLLLIGAHYDSVPESPGADDNASAVAAMLVCAKVISSLNQSLPVCFVSFNREEDSLQGSYDFVKKFLPLNNLRIFEAHILEMIGYTDFSPNSQTIPKGLPVKAPKVGDFLGLIGNRKSNHLINQIMNHSQGYLPDFQVLGLKVYCGLEKLFGHLLRSDHRPFWETGNTPALMWTDTSEFRNPNYHRKTDTPDTLDYQFLKKVTQLLIIRILTSSSYYEHTI